LATKLRRFQRISISVFIAVLIFGSLLLLNVDKKEEFRKAPIYSAVLRPSYIKMYKVRSISEFIERANKSF